MEVSLISITNLLVMGDEKLREPHCLQLYCSKLHGQNELELDRNTCFFNWQNDFPCTQQHAGLSLENWSISCKNLLQAPKCHRRHREKKCVLSVLHFLAINTRVAFLAPPVLCSDCKQRILNICVPKEASINTRREKRSPPTPNFTQTGFERWRKSDKQQIKIGRVQ